MPRKEDIMVQTIAWVLFAVFVIFLIMAGITSSRNWSPSSSF